MYRLIDIDGRLLMVHVVLSAAPPPPPPRVLFYFESNSDVNGSVNGACDDVIKRDKQTCVIS